MDTDLRLRLYYFPFPGRAGAIRDALAIGRVPYEDVHVPLDAFAARKAAGEFPFGALPVLHVITAGGTTVAAESNAILRFVGPLCGLYPTVPLAALKVDEALDLGEEFYRLIGPSIAESDAGTRAVMRRALAEETLPRWAGYLERLLLANDATHCIAGETLSVADLKLHWVLDKLTNGTLDGIPSTVLDGHPRLAAWRARVADERARRLAAAAG